jgi:ABC transporter substrate binding protein
MKYTLSIILLIVFAATPFCFAAEQVNKQKLLYINSYHKGYQWSDDVEKGLLKALKIKTRSDGSYDISESSVELKILRMDTKNNRTEDFKKQAAITAKKLIEKWQPDIVVASDDNASKYLIAPYYKDDTLPFVFCGVNWNASVYGFPASNITGMVEINPINELVQILKKYAKGERLGFIGANTITAQKISQYGEETLDRKFSDGKLVDTIDEWQQEYLKLQNSTDMVLWFGPSGIKGWDDEKALAFILEHTRVPTGAVGDNDIRYALIGLVGIAEEQGWWAGRTALKVLNGTSPAEIPLTTNKQSKLYLNMQLAKRMGIKFSMELIDQATFVEE